MMEKLKIIRFLLDEIEEEKMLFAKYKKEQQQAQKETAGAHSWHSLFWSRWEGRSPTKSRITSNAIKIRQLVMEIAKEKLP